MTAPRRHRARGGGDATTGAGSAALRGALLIGLAVVLGVILLGKGFDDGVVASGSDDDGAETGADDEGPDDPVTEQTTTTTVAARPPSEVLVFALNGFGGAGVAGAATDQLNAATYQTVPAADVPADQRVQASVVYFARGFEADAVGVATTLGLAPTTVMALPVPAPAQVPGGDVKGATVIVVLGPDYAPPA